MVSLEVNGYKISCKVQGKVIEVCAEELTAIDELRDRLSEQMEITRERATGLVIESLRCSLQVEE